ncbi:PREDICTED: mucin-5AC-like isoform X2 [Wasmannia auropunctata]|uniref:mucin-5AC-like isoform X2 n=1 Tax=Wasmannia auropunctata TaxID=64793 RepID=UPI0005EEAD0D|nr:PREDICTED: mucin-5AC-like isoform X2 [Wasmannia auropunctata]
MEISKSLEEEIRSVQQKLQGAILNHKIYVDRLKDDPNNPDILVQIKKIQVHIVSLGKCQKQVVQQLRKEVNAFMADNANGSKVSINLQSLLGRLGLNNNNHITNNNETKHEAANGFETKPSKEDYEEVVRNGDVHHSRPQDNDCAKLRPSSVETVSGEDDVVEVSLDENSDDKQEEEQKERSVESSEKYNYLNCLGLITKSKCMELQNRRVERKRRSTANPQFVYSMFEQPSKRKRHSYLQSGNAPHTRQTTARLNGPSPPPNRTQPIKSTSPPVTKSLIPIQKSTTRPNILRNADSKVFVNKSKVEDNQMRLPVTSAKSVQSIGNKAVHIPGLPSSLTIERIGSDSIVCISCENPGSLTVCRNCSSSYHVSCHTRPAPPSRTCPKCASAMDDEEDIEKDEEAEIKGQAEDESKLLRYKKDEKFEEKERERYELRERNSDLRLQVYELEKRSQLLGQSLQLQQRMRQDLLGKQEKTQRSIKRLVDFIKLIQLRKNASSPTSSASISCLPQPSSSRSPRTISPPQTSTSQKTASSPRPSIPNTDKTPYITVASSITSHDRASPVSKKTSPTPTSCPVPPSSQKSINHTSSSRKSPSRLEGPISLLAVKPKTKTVPQFSTTNCRPVAALPVRTLSNPSSPIPCSTIITTVRNKPIVQSHSIQSPYQNCQILFTPSRATISWTERPSTAGSPGPNSHTANSVSISQQDQPQKSYCLLATTPRIAATSSNCQDQPDQRKRQQQRQRVAVVASTDQETSSTHCSQAITSPISSPVVHVSHEAQTTGTARSCDSSSAARNTSWSCTSSQTASQQQSSSSGAPSRGSSST